jgi:hypothetical protein
MGETHDLGLSPEVLALAIRLESIFTPLARKRREEFYKPNPISGVRDSARFVHYTSAEAALSIIKNKRIWMRNAVSMADYREVQHGFDIYQRFFNNEENRAAFTTVCDECAMGVAAEAIDQFNKHWSQIRLHTYIASISEHHAEEDQHGRLSMWRGFGGTAARVALVLTIPWASGGGLALNLLFSPVAYLSEREAHENIVQVIANIKANRDFLRSLEREVVVSYVYITLLAGVTCLKHEGFREEREWRAIYSPTRAASDLMKCSTRVVAGAPQTVYEIPLDAAVSPALSGLEFSRIFDRLIVGPSQYAWPMYDAFTAALVEAGVPRDSAEQRVSISGIPIRT